MNKVRIKLKTGNLKLIEIEEDFRYEFNTGFFRLGYFEHKGFLNNVFKSVFVCHLKDIEYIERVD